METNETLTIQTNIIEKQPEVTTSLCDRFGINMYSETFLKQEVLYQQQVKEEQNELLHEVINNPKVDTKEAAFESVLTAETQAVLKKDYTDDSANTAMTTSYLYLMLGVVLAGVVLYYIEQKRRSKKTREDYSDHYQLRDEAKL